MENEKKLSEVLVMKIIDFEKKGNMVRFYLGANDIKEYHGDDWGDCPYEHNAGTVYDEYVLGYVDVTFDFDALVLEPQDDWRNRGNSLYCKDDMKARKVPCIIVVPENINDSWEDTFGYWVANEDVKKIYFGDSLNSLVKLGYITNESYDLTLEQMHEYGYHWDGMVPISKEMAVKLWEDGQSVFLLYEDGTESATTGELKEILNHDGVFGIEKKDM